MHEVVKRSQLRGAHLNQQLTITLCSVHNGWVEDHPKEAQRCGLSVPGWVWRRDGDKALREAAMMRRNLMFGIESSPYWLDNDHLRSVT